MHCCGQQQFRMLLASFLPLPLLHDGQLQAALVLLSTHWAVIPSLDIK